jgi:deoxynucleoside triphosphate triphosphohydrolase SAMHD1
MLLDYLIDENHIEIDRKDIKFVQSLIKGEIPQNVNDEKSEILPINFSLLGWMYEIIANKRNSLDVDKLDYLQRDAKHLGLQSVSF